MQQSRARALPPNPSAAIQGSSVPQPSIGTRSPRASASPGSDGPEVPLSVDTDAETAYAKGINAPVKIKRAVKDATGLSTPRDCDDVANRDPLHSPSIRRKWTSELLDIKASDVEASGNGFVGKAHLNHSPSPGLKPASPTPSSAGFFTRFRARSFPTLTSPFSTLHRGSRHLPRDPGSRTSVTSAPWSSDSSSEDLPLDSDRRHNPYPLSRRGGGADTDSGGEDGVD